MNSFIKRAEVTVPSSSATVPCSSATVPSSSATVPSSSTIVPNSSTTVPNSSNTLHETIEISRDVLDAEILWCLKAVTSHYSYKSSNDSGNIFSKMFPDSAIARRFGVSERKMAYLSHFGIAPYFQNLMYDELKKISHFTLLFDETLNKTSQKKQLDLHIRFWHTAENKVATRYLTSVFMGHATAANIFESFQAAVVKLDLKKLLQISMDGPAVNWSFYETLQKELKKEYNIECVSVGSCGLHILNNAFRKGAASTGWDITSILGACYYLFKDSPARREDFLAISTDNKLPLKFCFHRWLENISVSKRAYEIWGDIKAYVKAVESGKFSKISSKSFETLKEAVNDKLMPTKFLFFMCVSEVIKPFMELYQSDEPLIPFFSHDIQKLVKILLQRFKVLKEEETTKIISSIQYLCDFDFSEKDKHSEVSKVSLGFQADKALKELKLKKAISDKSYLSIKREAQTFIIMLLDKLMEKCPVAFSIVRNAICVNPKYMVENREQAETKMKNVLIYLSQKNQISEDDCDLILSQYIEFVENVAQSHLSQFKNYEVTKIRLDAFLYSFIDKKYFKLWEILKVIFKLSHGQASVERGFSINKNIEVENLADNSYIAQRRISDSVHQAGGVLNINITKEMKVSVSSAHSKYRLFIAEQKKKDDYESKKRKAEQEDSISLIEKRKLLETEIKNIESKAKELAQKGDVTKDFNLLTKSNDLFKTVCEKQALLREMNSFDEKRKKKT